MADDQPFRTPGDPAPPERDGDGSIDVDHSRDRADSAEWRSWHNLWQIPTILFSSLLIAAGIYIAVQNKPANDFDAALDQVERLIADNRLDLALTRLRDGIEPHLELASQAHRARFHALVGDWVYFAQADQRQKTAANHQRIDRQYDLAVDLGLVMGPARIERWAETLILMGELEAARKHLARLDAIDVAESGVESVRRRRNRIFRMLIEQSLNTPGASETTMLGLLSEYLKDGRLSLADRAWAVAQQAGIRLEAGRAREAVDHLLVDMRRLEQQAEKPDDVDFGPLYALLGRGYFDLGEHEAALAHLRQAMDRLGPHESARGSALVLLGRIAFGEADYEAAQERFDLVVREFVGTRSHLAGLLGRAEVRSVLGDHDGSHADYRRLRDRLSLEPPRRDVNDARIAESLLDRHDAALASRRLELALEYALIAEQFFDRSEVPSGILLRIASTSRELGERLLDGMNGVGAVGERPGEALDLETRRQANLHFKRAGEYAVRQARVLALRPDADDLWAAALWRGADAYDRGGWYDLAIAHFKEYIGSRSTEDPRRAEALFRLAQAHHAQLEFEKAAEGYNEVLENHPRSQFASASHVPLAQCYRNLDRTAEAEQQLRQVVSGQRFLDPEAMDFRDALIELGNLYHGTAAFTKAIETLTEAVSRYPDDPKRDEIVFHLADSYRGSAMQIDDRLESEVRLAPSERQRLQRIRDDQLQHAIQRYAVVCERLERQDQKLLSRLARDLLRQGYLYQADCLFHLGQFDAAIAMYDFAARKYAMHHSSMYALVQIVNCYSEMGEIERARAAHRRALVRLDQLPTDTFDAPDSLMDRLAWERWLENSPVSAGATASAMP